MKWKTVLSVVLFLLISGGIGKADPITLNVTSWKFSTSLIEGGTRWSINAVDQNGQEVFIGFNGMQGPPYVEYLNTPRGVRVTNDQNFNSILVVPAFFGGPDITNNRNGVLTFDVTGDIPQNLGSTVSTNRPSVSGGLTGSLIWTNGSQPFSLSLNLLPGNGAAFYFQGGLNFLDLSGTGGTVILNLPSTQSEVPEPATLALLGSGLAAIGIRRQRRRKRV